MPAAAVIPAPIAYIKIVAVKKLVVVSFASIYMDVCEYVNVLLVQSDDSCYRRLNCSTIDGYHLSL